MISRKELFSKLGAMLVFLSISTLFKSNSISVYGQQNPDFEMGEIIYQNPLCTLMANAGNSEVTRGNSPKLPEAFSFQGNTTRHIINFPISSSTAPRYGQITPPMGWNSWNEFRFNVSESLIIETADAMKMQKLDEAGYKYIVIDDGWQAQTLASDGSLMADSMKFPNGIAFLTDYVKSLGFELGIYSSPNVLTCGGYPGSLGFEKLHAKQFDNWGIRFLKYDYCPTRNNEQKNSSEIILERIRTMHSALHEINSDIIYAICEKGWVSGQIRYARNYREQIKVTPDNRKDLFVWAPELGTMWRTTADIAPRWSKIMEILDKQEGLAVLAGPGSFNDPDMLEVGNGELTYSENRAHFSLWCILAAPLFLGNDVRNMDDEILQIITNKELIALNQDKLCKQAEKVYDNGDIEIFFKPLENSDVGICILNRASTIQHFEMDWKDIESDVEKDDWSIRDLWAHEDLKMTPKSFIVEIKPHDVRVFRLSKSDGSILEK